ncbi:tyrosine-type recombinase/integrase [Rhodopirellula bahusiensis]|uniref:Tyr recombinase domain-containing protein n=1 Tax=Rhodopirellula bahusiensis TaxID=2014065 RepID=A0A2G1W0C8_9BACT|nr:site-specific integrase [Rhodopirellula bahusiensis]PHQ32455.1 hypothetical protein CEE69_25335 [Rhodopirellula bahusiensis]
MTAKQGIKKPDKPRPDFPLYALSNGQWCKKIAGRHQSFGPWEDPDGAEQAYLDWLARKRLNLSQPKPGEKTVDEIVDLYLDESAERVERKRLGQKRGLSAKTHREHKRHLLWFRDQVIDGHRVGSRAVASLRSDDFSKLYQLIPAHYSCDSIRHRVTYVNGLLTWAADNEFIDRVPATGRLWRIPTRDEVEAEKTSSPAKVWTRPQIKKLLASANPQIAAMIYLGMNAGFGNSDCARLKVDEMCGTWIEVPRGKNGRPRKAWLWPETVKAMKEARKACPKPRRGCEDLFFLTHTGGPWADEETFFDGVGDEFGELKRACGFDGKEFKGVGFYAFRHTFAEHASNATGNNADDIAVKHVLGHLELAQLATYRREIAKPRIKRVCERVRAWFLAGSGNQASNKQKQGKK